MLDATRAALAEGRADLPRIGAVVAGPGAWLPFVVVDAGGVEVDAVSSYLRVLMVGDASALTCRSYGHDLLRWYRLLWAVGTDWQGATEAEVALLVSWMRHAPNPQRRRRRAESSPAGSVNLKTGKPSLAQGYAPRTINHCLTVISNLYAHHARQGAGPVINPVPASPARRRALAHRSPIEARPAFRRGRLRQKVPAAAPRSIPDHLWGELFSAMTNVRDRALLAFYISSGARASELLGLRIGDVD